MRIQNTAHSNIPAHHRPLPSGNRLFLFVDDVPSAGAGDTCRLILALSTTDQTLVMLYDIKLIKVDEVDMKQIFDLKLIYDMK